MINRAHPDLQALLHQQQPLNLHDYKYIRAAMKNARPLPIMAGISLKDHMIDTDAGSLRVRVYENTNAIEELPGLLWIHGGGYVFGGPEGDDLLCQQFALECNCHVVSVDYRLAPDYQYPAAIEDCYSALVWMKEHARQLKINPKRLGIAGASAGGGLTAALSLLTKDRGGPKIVFQMPLYPMINDKTNTFSNQEIEWNLPWNTKLNETGWQMYLGDLKASEKLPIYAAAARATVDDLRGLPYTYTCVGQLDPLRDETIDYVSNLTKAGVDVSFHLYAGAYHIFERLNPHTQIGAEAVQEYVNAVTFGLHRTEASED